MHTVLDLLTKGWFGLVHLGFDVTDVYSLLGPPDGEILPHQQPESGGLAQWGGFQIGWTSTIPKASLDSILLEFYSAPAPVALQLDLLGFGSALNTIKSITGFAATHNVILTDTTPSYMGKSTWLTSPSTARLGFNETGLLEDIGITTQRLAPG